uniref:E3 ubiquitin-protein ligase NEURL1B-like n=1 Tax=Crassostrea virginica TaxID=6565 RepID=A0A8B8ES10_CRAVI|nr:E3 ubiquitin-protein ligase NEURL1B-like [Crassostrea virginica]
MRRFPHSWSGQGNTFNLQVGHTFNFYFGQASSPSNAPRAISGITNTHLDPGSYTSRPRDDDRSERLSMSRGDDRSERWSMSRDDDSSERSKFSRLNNEVNELRNLMEAFLETQAGSGANSGRTNGTRELDTAASSNHCVVCRDEVSNSVIYNCGHMCICQACGIQLKNRNSTCPVCRAPIRDIIRVYRN